MHASVAPLSGAQSAMWYTIEREPASSVFNLLDIWRLDGVLDTARLVSALTEVVRRHDALRTCIRVSGAAEQLIQPDLPVTMDCDDLVDLSAEEQQGRLQAIARDQRRRPFDLFTAPLWRFKLVRVAADRHILFRTIHHLIFDAASARLFLAEFMAIYRGSAPAALDAPRPIQYSEFARDERLRLASGELDDDLAYWSAQLSDAPSGIALPVDRDRILGSRDGGACRLTLDAGLATAIVDASRKLNVTPGTYLLAAFSVLLARWSGQAAIAIGMLVTLRRRPGLQGTIGPLNNIVVLRVNVPDGATFLDVLAEVRRTALGGQRHCGVPFEEVARITNASGDNRYRPLFQVTFNLLESSPASTNETIVDLSSMTASAGHSGLAIADVESLFDLSLQVASLDPMRLTFVYDANQFERRRIEEALAQLRTLLAQLVGAPELPVTAHSLIVSGGDATVPDPAKPLSPTAATTVVTRVMQRAERRPDAVAVDADGRMLTYRQLQADSGAIADRVGVSGLGQQVIAIFAGRTPAMIAAMLGVWRAGGAFTVLDPDLPSARLEAHLRLCRPSGFINASPIAPVPQPLAEILSRLQIPDLSTTREAGGDRSGEPVSGRDAGTDQSHHLADTAAYLAMTSGTTGAPQVVIADHGPVAHFVSWYENRFGLCEADRCSVLSGLAHDPLLRDVFVPLSIGATVCIPSFSVAKGEGLANWLLQRQVTVAHLTPALGRALEALPDELPLRLLGFGGEPLTHREARRAHRAAPRAAIVNLYGTTETPQAMSAAVVDCANLESPGRWVPLGRGIADVDLLVVNAAGRQCGVGELGEIWVRTPYLSRGYVDDPELTNRKYGVNPWTNDPADRVFRTGDLGRYDWRGNVHYAGRLEGYIKIRGHRVDLSEIETVLRGCSGVDDAAVLLSDVVTDDDPRLIAYLLCATAVDPSAVRAELRQHLPRYMVPASLNVVSEWPLTRNHKLDRAALSRIAPTSAGSRNGTPRSTFEQEMCGLFAEVLQVSMVNVDDDFFDLGGHSLTAARLITRIRRTMSVNVSLQMVFEHSTPASLGAMIDGLARSADPVLSIDPS